MDKLLKKYTKLRIAEICGVQPKTVHNWFDKKSMPYWAIERLGFSIILSADNAESKLDEIRKIVNDKDCLGE